MAYSWETKSRFEKAKMENIREVVRRWPLTTKIEKVAESALGDLTCQPSQLHTAMVFFLFFALLISSLSHARLSILVFAFRVVTSFEFVLCF